MKKILYKNTFNIRDLMNINKYIKIASEKNDIKIPIIKHITFESK